MHNARANLDVAGIDPDTICVTIVSGTRADPIITLIPLGEAGNHIEGCGLAFRGLCEFIANHKEETGRDMTIYLEAPVVGKGGPGPTISQAQIGGSLMAACEEFLTPLSLVNNSAWKKRAIGNGNYNKDQITERMKEIWPAIYEEAKGWLPLKGTPGGGPFRDQNIIDAAGIFLFGKHNYELKQRILKRRSRV